MTWFGTPADRLTPVAACKILGAHIRAQHPEPTRRPDLFPPGLECRFFLDA